LTVELDGGLDNGATHKNFAPSSGEVEKTAIEETAKFL
jgi:hypothetical protein